MTSFFLDVFSFFLFADVMSHDLRGSEYFSPKSVASHASGRDRSSIVWNSRIESSRSNAAGLRLSNAWQNGEHIDST